jgi:hypothetical protein
VRLASQDLLKLAHAASLHKLIGAPDSPRHLLLLPHLVCVLMLLYMCAHVLCSSELCLTAPGQSQAFAFTGFAITGDTPHVRICIYMCPHTAIYEQHRLYQPPHLVCPHTAIYVCSCPLHFRASSHSPPCHSLPQRVTRSLRSAAASSRPNLYLRSHCLSALPLPLPLSPPCCSVAQTALRSCIKPPPLPRRSASASEPPVLFCVAACAPQLHQAIFG